MLTWKFIKKSEDVSFGYTEEGLPYLQTFIQGWNNNEAFTDLTNLVTVRTVFHDPSNIEVQKEYVHPDARSNVTVLKFANEAADELVELALQDSSIAYFTDEDDPYY